MMYFTTIVPFAALPFFVGGVPVSLNSPRSDSLISIPLSKRSNHFKDDGFVDLEKLQAGVQHTMAKIDRALSMYEKEPTPLHGSEGTRTSAAPLSRLLLSPMKMWCGLETSYDLRHAHPRYAPHWPFLLTCSGHSQYDISTSSTGKNLSSMTIEDGFSFASAEGTLVSDTVIVNGNSVIDQKILVATSIDPGLQFPGFLVDGIMGLGFKRTGAIDADSFFTTLVSSGGPSNGEAVFALVISEFRPEFIGGGTDSSKFLGNLTYINLDAPGLWHIPVDSIAVNGSNISTNSTGATLDSAGAFVIADNVTISNIYSNIPGAAPFPNPNNNKWTIPCDTNVTVSVTLGGTAFNTAPSTYNLGSVANNTKNVCTGGFLSSSSLNLTLGTVFLQNVYTEFDQGNLRAGMAPIS